MGLKWVPFQEPLRNKVVPGETNHTGGSHRLIIGRLTPNSCPNAPIDVGNEQIGANRAKWGQMGPNGCQNDIVSTKQAQDGCFKAN